MVTISTGYVGINGVRMFAKIHTGGSLRNLAVDIMCHKHESYSYTCPVKNYYVTKIGSAIRIYAGDAVSRLDANHDINQVVDGIIRDVNLKVFVESVKF